MTSKRSQVNSKYIGLRDKPDESKVDLYLNDKTVPKFDFHPKYKPENSVFIVCSGKTGKPLGKEEKTMPNTFPFGKLMYVQLVMELGDRGLLIGGAYSYYLSIKKQLERTVIKEFRKYDSFCDEKDRMGIDVVKQEKGMVYYHKMGPVKGRKFWQCPTDGMRKMPTHKFAYQVLKLHYNRYKYLIPVELTVPK